MDLDHRRCDSGVVVLDGDTESWINAAQLVWSGRTARTGTG
jgi:hypothetical protein